MFRAIFAALLLALSGTAFAANVTNLNALTQTQFKGFSADLGSALVFKQLSPAEPEGIPGFDIGIDVSGTKIEHEAAWAVATKDSDISSMLPMARLRARVGVSGTIDVGAFYAEVPGSNIKAYGGELRYALVNGGIVRPSLNLRAAYSHLNGVDDLDMTTKSVTLSISKGFGPLTPFAGIGHVWVSSDPAASTGLKSVSPSSKEYFAGINIGMGIVDLTLAANRIDDDTTYSVKLALGF